MNDTKFLKRIATDCPIAYAKFFGKKYVLPKYRQADYYDMNFESLTAFDRCLQLGLRNMDDVGRCYVANTFAALHYNRPTLYLERELGEALLRTSMLSDLTTGDIKWRWPALKIVLPKGLISIDREDGPRSLTHFDVCQVDPNSGIHVPREIGHEFDRFFRKIEPDSEPNFNAIDFLYKENGLVISSAIDVPEMKEVHQTLYGVIKPWGSIKVQDYHAVQGQLDTAFPRDAADDVLLNRLEHLVINTLLFLSSAPLEYEKEQVVRPSKREGSRIIPGLFAARFVGQMQLRPIRTGTGVHSTPTGRTVAPHWKSGHWQRIVHGVGRTERRIAWIEPYPVGYEEEEDEK